MRLPWESDRARAVATLEAALDAGVTWFDTARAYGDDHERGLAEVLRARGAVASTTVVTKAGMVRDGTTWRPDGRARAIEAHAEASQAALADVPIGVLLLHAPDPAVPWSTSLRALAKLHAAGAAARIGVSNVSRAQLDEALALAPISAIEVALSPADDDALAGGVIGRALERGLTVLVHAPFGGPARAPRWSKDPALAAVARACGATAHEVLLAALHALDPAIVPLPGATRPETAASVGRAAALVLDEAARAALEVRLGWARKLRPPPAPARREGAAEVVLLMGLPGAGKSTRVAEWEARGYARLNRDARGGTLDALHAELDRRLAAGEPRFVLDNLYLTRAGRRAVLDVALRHGARARVVWLDTPVAEAERNVATRIVQSLGALPEPEALVRSKVPGVMPPTTVLRLAKELEPPEADEGFDTIEVAPFVRAPSSGGVAGRVVAIERVVDGLGAVRPDAARWLAGPGPVLVFGWRAPPGAGLVRALVEAGEGAPVTVAVCAHGGGPPRCWCRPPRLGLLLAWALPLGIDWAASTLVGASAVHPGMAEALGARYDGLP